ncbi:MAG: GatB/YqeY domain-containing protein [Bacteroidia bacterium]
MSLEEKINNDLKDAMRSKNEAALRALRAVKSVILIAKTDKGAGSQMSQDDELKILQKLAKQRRESAEIYQQQNREDLAKAENEELEIIEKYLPAQMSEEDLRAEIKKIIDETGASSPAEMGKVMGVASKKLAGKADNKKISEITRELLAG